MPRLFRCPLCGYETWVNEQVLGQSGPCVKCGAIVTVESNPEMKAPAPGANVPITVNSPKRKDRVRQLLPLAAWLAAGITASGVLVLTSWLLFRQFAPPALVAGSFSAQQAMRGDHFQRLAAALQAYHNDKGHFPPAFTTDKQGTPLHSWRVLLLPYLRYQDLYQKFDLEQPWDSPENLELVNAMPDVYACPFDLDRMPGETSCLAIAGPDLAFNGSQHRGLSDITDVPSKTLLLIETCGAGVVWTRPKDLDGRQVLWSAQAQKGGIGCQSHDGTLWVVTADGRAHLLTSAIPPESLRSLATLNGGESEPLVKWTR